MSNETTKTVGRNLWGWFVICVWICGVPQVVKYTIMGVKMAGSGAVCAVAEAQCVTTPPK